MSEHIILKSLRIKNFASYKEAFLDFGELDYPVFVVGDNGAGKTTFFVDSLTYALLGRAYGNVKFRKDLIASFHDTRITTEVELVLDFRGIEYHILRRSGEASENILLIDYGNGVRKSYTSKKEVDRVLEELLGLSYDNILETFIVRQGLLTSFIRLNPSERRDKLINLLHIDFKNIRDNVKKDLNKLNLKISEYSGIKSSIENQFRREGIEEVSIDIIDEKLKDADGELKKLKNNLKLLEDKYREIDDKRRKLISEIGKYNALMNEINKLKESESKIRDEIHKFIRENIEEEYYEDIVRKITLINEQMQNALKRIESLSKIKSLIEDAIELKENIDWLREKLRGIKAVENEMELLLKTKGEYEHRLKILDNNIEQLMKKEGKCPLCGRELDEAMRDKLVNKFRDEKERVKKELNNLAVKIRESRDVIKNKDSIMREMENKRGRLNIIIDQIESEYRNIEITKKLDENLLRDEIKYIEEKLNNINGFIEALKIEVERYLNPIQEYNKLSNILDNLADNIRMLNEYRERINGYKEEVKNLLKNMKASRIDDLRKELDLLDKEYSDLHKKIGDIKTELGSLLKTRENLIKLKDEAVKYQNICMELKSLNYKARVLEKLYKEVFNESGFPLYYLQNLVNKILTENVNRYLRRIYPPLEVKYSVNKSGISLDVYMDGKIRDISTLSGGELTILGLATRLGLGEFLRIVHSKKSRPGFLIIDEGFGPLDEDNRLKVSEIFRNLVDSSLYPQVIVISHEREIMNSNYFNSIIEVYKEKGFSKLRIKSF